MNRYGYGLSMNRYGYGYGYRYGYGIKIAMIGDYNVELLSPFPYIKIGCQIHTLNWWCNHWRSVARSEKINISETEVKKIIDQIKKRTW